MAASLRLHIIAVALFAGIACMPALALAQEPPSQESATTSTTSTFIEEFVGEENSGLPFFRSRPVTEFTWYSAFAYWIQKAAESGVPIDTIILILLLPVLATLVAFVRIIVGLPSLEMLVPIALAYTFVALGISLGLLILGAIVAASLVSRSILARVEIMQFPKRSISLLLLALFVFAALTVSSAFGLADVSDLSIFPVLILTLLGESFVSVQLRHSMQESALITVVTISLGLIGFLIATVPVVRNAIVLYPELVLLTVPVNVLMGRYFGLRLSEYFRFRA